MVKILVETGSGSHTTSSGSVVVKFSGGEYDGQNLYEQKQFITGKPVWNNAKTNERWVTTIYELPEGTEIAIIAYGRTGNRGVNEHEFHQIFRIDSNVEVMEGLADCGIYQCDFKGRLVLVRDVLKEQEKAAKQHREEGF
jgi:hypothetical protein